jgi:hypothetical protein
MRRYSEAIKADVRRRMSPPNRQSVARISEETGNVILVTVFSSMHFFIPILSSERLQDTIINPA